MANKFETDINKIRQFNLENKKIQRKTWKSRKPNVKENWSRKSLIVRLFVVIVFRCLEGVVNLHKEIKEDEYLVPYAIVEIAWLYIDGGRIDAAIAALEDAK